MKNIILLAIVLFISGCATDLDSLKNSVMRSKVNDSNQSTELSIGSKVAILNSDKLCKNLVEPYDYISNVAAITKLVAKVEVTSLIGGLSMSNNEKLRIYKNGLKELNWMPLYLEKELGETMHKQNASVLPNKGRSARYYKEANTILKEIVDQIKEPEDYHFEIYIVRGAQKEAYTYPGGKIYVTKSFLQNKEYAKFSIAHEVSHILKRHYTMQYQKIILDSIDNYDDIIKIKNSIIHIPTGGGNSGLQPIYLKISSILATKKMLFKLVRNFTINNELEADACAVRLLYKDKDINNIVNNFYKNLQKSTTIESNDPMDFTINTHPSSQERLDNIYKALNYYTLQLKKSKYTIDKFEIIARKHQNNHWVYTTNTKLNLYSDKKYMYLHDLVETEFDSRTFEVKNMQLLQRNVVKHQ